ncbi:MAG: indole-3-glycerol phosphate synthase TrpC [Flavobacteriales bacterium]|nr:indole-3-glycerol phosphate synthase TrpC [Flavobacteriales bacterium]
MSILEQIIQDKRAQVALNKSLKPLKLLERSIYYETKGVSMKTYLQRDDKTGIIAEIKRSSPSTGLFKHKLDVSQLSVGYMQAGATALSVLTDPSYFKGSDADLSIARKYNYCPILRKEFIIDEYQIVEAKSIGADCILLIAACLSPQQCKALAAFAKSLGLEVLLEVHDQSEIESHLNEHLDLVGVNNRNLHDFSTNIQQSIKLAPHIPDEFIRISESGISSADQIISLKKHGFKGFLIGGYFMKQAHPEKACKKLIDNLILQDHES